MNWHKFISPQWFYDFSGKCLPYLSIFTSLLFAYGLIGGLLFAPPDYQQGDGFRIIYVHVPSAFLSMLTYMAMAVCALISLIWRIKLADIMVRSAAPIGAWMTALALITGSLWGKPMWGTFWIWDARLTSELILLFLYLGYLALYNAFQNSAQGARAANILLLVGIVNIPIIHYSVYWWNTLHQGTTIKLTNSSIAPSMLHPLLAMIAAFMLYSLIVVVLRARNQLLWQESRAKWVKHAIS